MKSIEYLHNNKIGKGSDKWESYLYFYDGLFKQLQDESISLLEIGVQNGGSLETWAQYFESADLIVGCDINQACSKLVFDDTRIKVVIGNINSQNAYDQIIKYKSEYDIIIDDGSHVSSDVMTSFLVYFYHLKPGGIYVIEDTHTLYMNAYGGGILNEASAMSFFKKLADLPNFQFWQSDLSISEYFSIFFEFNKLPAVLGEGWVESVEFRNSLIIIKKSLIASHSK